MTTRARELLNKFEASEVDLTPINYYGSDLSKVIPDMDNLDTSPINQYLYEDESIDHYDKAHLVIDEFLALNKIRDISINDTLLSEILAHRLVYGKITSSSARVAMSPLWVLLNNIR